MTIQSKKKVRTYTCGLCGRKLRGKWVYSKHTGARYCYPGKGCAK